MLVRGLRGGDRLGVVLGLVIAAQIAAYTLVDAEGIQDANPVPYLLFALLPAAVGAALVSGRERLRAEWSGRAVLAGCGGFLAYVLVLAALRSRPPRRSPRCARRASSSLSCSRLRSSASASRAGAWRGPCSSSRGSLALGSA